MTVAQVWTAWVLSMVMRLVAIEGPAPWADYYPVLAEEIAALDATPDQMALLVAIAWRETRLSPRNPFQLSPHWGTPSARTALTLSADMTHYACAPPWTHPACARVAADRHHIAATLLRALPPPWAPPLAGLRLVP